MQRGSSRAKQFCAFTTLSLVVGAVAVYGRHPRRSVPAGHAPSQRIRAVPASTSVSDAYAEAIARVQRQPLYHLAQTACSRRQYRHAADLLSQLAHAPGQSSSESEFILQQRDVCLRDAGVRVPPTRRLRQTPEHPTPEHQTPAQSDCGPRALMLVCNRFGIRTTLPQLRQRAGTTGRGTSLAGLATAAKSLGLKTEGVQVSREALPGIATPALAYVNGNHYVTLLSLRGNSEEGTATIHDPNRDQEETVSQERLLRLSSGYLLLVHR